MRRVSHDFGRFTTGLAAQLLVLATVVPNAAHAHTGVGATRGLLAGALHPLGGLDHLCAMVAVGLLAAQRGGRARWAIPLAFVGLMTLGALLAMAGVALPLAEQGIVLSVLLLGVLVAAAARVPLVAGAGLAAVFGLAHGHAHGSEMPATASGIAYSVGFVFTTIALHAAGFAIAAAFAKAKRPLLTRVAGAGVAGAGVLVLIG